ncbi:unnamed protein product [Amoebophrya sp. A120]|nr:unnamed protein product [Amoebophrya sp. A120]|eukprot:GSA120T00003106001.1
MSALGGGRIPRPDSNQQTKRRRLAGPNAGSVDSDGFPPHWSTSRSPRTNVNHFSSVSLHNGPAGYHFSNNSSQQTKNSLSQFRSVASSQDGLSEDFVGGDSAQNNANASGCGFAGQNSSFLFASSAEQYHDRDLGFSSAADSKDSGDHARAMASSHQGNNKAGTAAATNASAGGSRKQGVASSRKPVSSSKLPSMPGGGQNRGRAPKKKSKTTTTSSLSSLLFLDTRDDLEEESISIVPADVRGRPFSPVDDDGDFNDEDHTTTFTTTRVSAHASLHAALDRVDMQAEAIIAQHQQQRRALTREQQGDNYLQSNYSSQFSSTIFTDNEPSKQLSDHRNNSKTLSGGGSRRSAGSSRGGAKNKHTRGASQFANRSRSGTAGQLHQTSTTNSNENESTSLLEQYDASFSRSVLADRFRLGPDYGRDKYGLNSVSEELTMDRVDRDQFDVDFPIFRDSPDKKRVTASGAFSKRTKIEQENSAATSRKFRLLQELQPPPLSAFSKSQLHGSSIVSTQAAGGPSLSTMLSSSLLDAGATMATVVTDQSLMLSQSHLTSQRAMLNNGEGSLSQSLLDVDSQSKLLQNKSSLGGSKDQEDHPLLPEEEAGGSSLLGNTTSMLLSNSKVLNNESTLPELSSMLNESSMLSIHENSLEMRELPGELQRENVSASMLQFQDQEDNSLFLEEGEFRSSSKGPHGPEMVMESGQEQKEMMKVVSVVEQQPGPVVDAHAAGSNPMKQNVYAGQSSASRHAGALRSRQQAHHLAHAHATKSRHRPHSQQQAKIWGGRSFSPQRGPPSRARTGGSLRNVRSRQNNARTLPRLQAGTSGGAGRRGAKRHINATQLSSSHALGFNSDQPDIQPHLQSLVKESQSIENSSLALASPSMQDDDIRKFEPDTLSPANHTTKVTTFRDAGKVFSRERLGLGSAQTPTTAGGFNLSRAPSSSSSATSVPDARTVLSRSMPRSPTNIRAGFDRKIPRHTLTAFGEVLRPGTSHEQSARPVSQSMSLAWQQRPRTTTETSRSPSKSIDETSSVFLPARATHAPRPRGKRGAALSGDQDASLADVSGSADASVIEDHFPMPAAGCIDVLRTEDLRTAYRNQLSSREREGIALADDHLTRFAQVEQWRTDLLRATSPQAVAAMEDDQHALTSASLRKKSPSPVKVATGSRSQSRGGAKVESAIEYRHFAPDEGETTNFTAPPKSRDGLVLPPVFNDHHPARDGLTSSHSKKPQSSERGSSRGSKRSSFSQVRKKAQPLSPKEDIYEHEACLEGVPLVKRLSGRSESELSEITAARQKMDAASMENAAAEEFSGTGFHLLQEKPTQVHQSQERAALQETVRSPVPVGVQPASTLSPSPELVVATAKSPEPPVPKMTPPRSSPKDRQARIIAMMEQTPLQEKRMQVAMESPVKGLFFDTNNPLPSVREKEENLRRAVEFAKNGFSGTAGDTLQSTVAPGDLDSLTATAVTLKSGSGEDSETDLNQTDVETLTHKSAAGGRSSDHGYQVVPTRRSVKIEESASLQGRGGNGLILTDWLQGLYDRMQRGGSSSSSTTSGVPKQNLNPVEILDRVVLEDCVRRVHTVAIEATDTKPSRYESVVKDRMVKTRATTLLGGSLVGDGEVDMGDELDVVTTYYDKYYLPVANACGNSLPEDGAVVAAGVNNVGRASAAAAVADDRCSPSPRGRNEVRKAAQHQRRNSASNSVSPQKRRSVHHETVHQQALGIGIANVDQQALASSSSASASRPPARISARSAAPPSQIYAMDTRAWLFLHRLAKLGALATTSEEETVSRFFNTAAESREHSPVRAATGVGASTPAKNVQLEVQSQRSTSPRKAIGLMMTAARAMTPMAITPKPKGPKLHLRSAGGLRRWRERRYICIGVFLESANLLIRAHIERAIAAAQFSQRKTEAITVLQSLAYLAQCKQDLARKRIVNYPALASAPHTSDAGKGDFCTRVAFAGCATADPKNKKRKSEKLNMTRDVNYTTTSAEVTATEIETTDVDGNTSDDDVDELSSARRSQTHQTAVEYLEKTFQAHLDSSTDVEKQKFSFRLAGATDNETTTASEDEKQKAGLCAQNKLGVLYRRDVAPHADGGTQQSAASVAYMWRPPGAAGGGLESQQLMSLQARSSTPSASVDLTKWLGMTSLATPGSSSSGWAGDRQGENGNLKEEASPLPTDAPAEFDPRQWRRHIMRQSDAIYEGKGTGSRFGAPGSSGIVTSFRKQFIGNWPHLHLNPVHYKDYF